MLNAVNVTFVGSRALNGRTAVFFVKVAAAEVGRTGSSSIFRRRPGAAADDRRTEG
jgi:hypothetical protein